MNSDEWFKLAQIGVPVIVACIGAIAYWVNHQAQKGIPEHRLIDQLQEQLDKSEARSDKQDERFARIEAKLGLLERTNRILLEYTYALRRHIAERRDPPAPEWPSGIHDS